jgi:uncharacterized membrane protein YecN with MAPEG domain
MPIIVPAYAAILALIFAALSFRVANTRRVLRTPLGIGGHTKLERYIRVQGNFAEYVPFALLLLFFLEMQAWPAWLVHVLCAVFLAARVVHALGVAQEKEDFRLRIAGMITTLSVFIVTALLLLAGGILRGGA